MVTRRSRGGLKSEQATRPGEVGSPRRPRFAGANQPCHTSRGSVRHGGRIWAAAFLAALGLYVATLAPDLMWQDSGYYQWEAARLNFSRPGEAVRVHPWFLLAARAMGAPRLFSYAYAANLASAVGTAAAVANLALLVALATGRLWPAAVAAASFALGHAVWWHAVMAETYGWAAALLLGECLCAWAFATRGRPCWLALVFFINGVAISNHLMAALSLAVFGVWALVLVVRGRARWWVLPAAAGCWLIGGTLYWIVIGLEHARTGDLAATVRSATVGGYGAAVANLSALPGLLGRSALYVALNYPTPLVLVAVPGLVVAWRRLAAGRVMVVLAAVFLAWAVRYRVPDQYAFFVPFYALAGVLIGLGAAEVMRRRPAWWVAAALGALAALPAGVYAVLPAAARAADLDLVKQHFRRELPYRDSYVYFLQPWKTGYGGARRFADEVLASLPAGAVLLPDTTASPPLKCLQDLEGRRRDAQGRPEVLIVDPCDARFDAAQRAYWPRRPGPGEPAPAPPREWREGRPVFVVSEAEAYLPAWVAAHGRLEPFGIIYQVKPRGAEEAP